MHSVGGDCRRFDVAERLPHLIDGGELLPAVRACRDVTPHLKRLYDAFGPRRCHWGTDVTNSYAKATYRQRVTHFTEELAFLSEDDKDWIMGKSIVERLRWT